MNDYSNFIFTCKRIVFWVRDVTIDTCLWLKFRGHSNRMHTMSISKFKATCLAVLERVRKTGEPLLITKHGVPIAQVLPAPSPPPQAASAFGCMADAADEVEDILAPLTDEDWEVLR